MKRILWIGLLAAVLLPGCRRMRPHDGPSPWWRRLLEAPNKMYYDERSRDIEQSLERTNDIRISG